KFVSIRKCCVGVHRERCNRALRHGACKRGNGWCERGSSSSARAIFVRWMERVTVRCRRHHWTRIDRVLDQVEEDDYEVEQGARRQLDELGMIADSTDC